MKSNFFVPSPSPAEPVKVLGEDLGKAASDLLDFLEQYTHEYSTDISGYVDAVQEAIPSHAAHLAKIQALEGVIQDFVRWYDSDSDESFPVERLRAALALPTAPRSDS